MSWDKVTHWEPTVPSRGWGARDTAWGSSTQARPDPTLHHPKKQRKLGPGYTGTSIDATIPLYTGERGRASPFICRGQGATQGHPDPHEASAHRALQAHNAYPLSSRDPGPRFSHRDDGLWADSSGGNISISQYDRLESNVKEMVQCVGIQSRVITLLERKVEERLDKLEKEIQAVLKEFAKGRKDDRKERKLVVREARTALRDITSALQRQGRLVDGPLVGGKELNIGSDLGILPSYVEQPTVDGRPDRGPDDDVDYSDIDTKALVSANLAAASAERASGGPTTSAPIAQSVFSWSTNDETFYTAQDSIVHELQTGDALQQPKDVALADLLPTFDAWAQISPEADHVDAQTQGFLPPAGECQAEDMLETMSLSSGIESLPSDCTRSEADTQAPCHLDSSGYAKIKGPTRTIRKRRALRERLNSVDYISHPMDSQTKKAKAAAQAKAQKLRDKLMFAQSDTSLRESEEPERRVRGRSVLVQPDLLPASDGVRGENEFIWPKRGANTVKGRLEQEVECDSCKGRVHWACAGFEEHSMLLQQAWFCPNCVREYDTCEEGPVEISVAQQERCLRPDCILRSSKTFQRRNRDEDEFLIERIVGRKRISLPGSSKTRYEFLIKWVDYPIWDCTWEKPSHIPDLQVWQDRFMEAIKASGVDLTFRRTALLPETEEYWDEKGDLKIKKLIAEGVEPKEWWF